MGEVLIVYAVRNEAGEWMRSTGYGGRGKHWVPEIANAKLYTKIGQARGRVSFWASHAPDKKPPVIVRFAMQLSSAEVLDEEDRVAKAKLKKATADAEYRKREARRKMGEAIKTIERAEAEIARIRAADSGGQSDG